MILGLNRLPQPGLPQEAPGRPRAPWGVLLRRLGSNEHLATFALLSCVVLSAVWSVEKARWVPALHSLSWVAIVALATGYLVARSRWPGILLHLLAAALGSWIVLWQASLLLPAGSWGTRLSGVLIELRAWGHAVTTGETTGGVITFAVMILGLTWLLGYLSAWFVFRGHRVWWVILLSALMILINLSSLPSRFYVHLLPFLIASLFLVAHSNIVRRQQRWRRSQIRYPRFARVSFLGYALCFGLLVALIAWSLPLFRPAPLDDLVQPVASAWEQRVEYQLNRLFASVSSKNPNYHVSDPPTLRFGGSPNLSDQIIFTVDSSEPRYWRIRNYDVYTSDSWLSSEGVEIPLDERGSGLNVERPLLRTSMPHTLTLNVYSPVFFSAGEPLSVDVSAMAEIRKPQTQPGADDVVLFRPKGGWNLRPFQRYTLVSSYSVARPDDMRAAGMNYPSWVLNSYLNLPSELPNRVILLSQDITRGIDNPYDKIWAIQSYLLKMQYSLNINAPPQGADGVDYFLFEQRVGYCQYFASAMVVMLRSIEIPARLVVGYSGGELDEGNGVYVVRERNSHAWAEVYFPQYGWVEFDPTPGSGQTTGPPIMGSQLGLPPSGPAPIPTTNDSSSAWVLWVVLTSAAGLLIIGRVAIILPRRRSQNNMAKLDYPAQVYARMCRLASLSRLAPKPQHTPLEYASRLALALPSRATAIEQVAQVYSEARYSVRKDLAVREKEDLEKAWHYLRMALWGRFLKFGVTCFLKGK